ncbi:LysR substrate-binding domain-containing protein [Phenylobacterium sp.]|jgi:LysR family glycine cleavage system transcriptional activator|uniref:LysR substrate-binding domain-containing protein n=1 Tax=Phenylobacterium sp. TaxID=1871053 RepID=UPI0037832E8A
MNDIEILKHTPAAGLVAERKAIPPFASLRAFEAVGRVGGVRKAALELCVDHAVVSRHLRALEAWLGRALFDRSSATPKLNAAGRRYHAAISASMMEVARATREVMGGEKGDRLLIWCVPGFATRWLAAALDHFSELNPGIEVELRPTDAAPDFNADEADGDIRFVRDIADAGPPPGVDWLTFARPQVFPVASRQWLDANPIAGEPSDFLTVKMLHEENDEEWRGWFAAHGVETPARLPGSRLWHAHMTLDAARRGQGVALANPFLIADDILDGVLEPVSSPPGVSLGAEIGAYVFAMRDDAAKRPAMRKLREWTLARAAEFLGEPVPGAEQPATLALAG